MLPAVFLEGSRMRRSGIVLALAVASAVPALAGPVDFNLFASVDTGGALAVGSLDVDTERGYSLGLEVLADLPLADLGGGAEYGVPRKLDATVGEYSYTFVYVVARVALLGPLYAVARYGYLDPTLGELESADPGSGTGWGAGVGFSLLDALKVEVQHTELGGDVDYTATVARVILTF